MKTDHELNEGAARAAGIPIQWDEGTGGFICLSASGADVDSWNPLESARQATDLAAKLKMRTWHSQERACAEFGSVWDNTQHYGSYAQPYSESGGDAVKAMLRAITGAAAAYEPPNEREPMSYQHPEAVAPTDAQLLELKAQREAAAEVEARVHAKLHERLNAYVHGALTLRPNNARTLAELNRIVAEVIDAELPPPPFTVLLDTDTNPHKVSVSFAYPLGPIL